VAKIHLPYLDASDAHVDVEWRASRCKGVAVVGDPAFRAPVILSTVLKVENVGFAWSAQNLRTPHRANGDILSK
jgi:hypothetical protein